MSSSEKVLHMLQSANKEDRLHHAYIFSGPEGKYKRDCAERFLASIGQTSDQLDEASRLEKVRRGNDPDFYLIQPSANRLISVDETRELPKVLAYAPMNSQKRVVFIEQADSMNVQAANAILKILEEPPSHTMFFLSCRDPSALLETIRSRCQNLRFSPIHDLAQKEQLRSKYPKASDSEIRFAMVLSEGAPQRAEDILAMDGFVDLVREAMDALLLAWENSPRIPSASVAFVESLGEQTDISLAVSVWELLIADLGKIIANHQVETSLPMDRERISFVAKRYTDSDLFQIGKKAECINRFRVYSDFNGNKKLDLLSLFCELQIFPRR